MTAKQIIKALDLAPHPEGGWYRETWRSDIAMDGPMMDGAMMDGAMMDGAMMDGAMMDGAPDGRASATAIHFLLAAGQRSAWHRVDAAEIWLWHGGDPLTLSIKPGRDDAAQSHLLGGDILAGQQPQILVPAGHWQAAEPVPGGAAGYVLVSCIVSPGFEFSGFELAGFDRAAP